MSGGAGSTANQSLQQTNHEHDTVRFKADLSSHETLIPMQSGTLSVQPYRSSGSSKKMKALVTYTPRASGLDHGNVTASSDQFRGFYSLFWIGLFLLFFRTSYISWETNQTLISLTFGELITRDALVLAISDAVMVGSMFVCVPFVKGIVNGYYDYYWVGAAIQHTWQACFLGMAVWWGFHRQWYWVQSGFLVLHALSSMMKMHSYCAHNGMLSNIAQRLKKEQDRLADLLARQADQGVAICAEAAENQEAEEAKQREEESVTEGGISSIEGTPLPIGTPNIPVGSTAVAEGILGDSGSLRMRLTNKGVLKPTLSTTSVNSNGKTNELEQRNSPNNEIGSETPKTHIPSLRPTRTASMASQIPLGTSLEPTHNHPRSSAPYESTPRHPLSYSSDPLVQTLAKNIDLMTAELTSHGCEDESNATDSKTGTHSVVWPHNVSYKEYWIFMCMPTLCYQLSYPRTRTLRPLYVVEKVFATFGVFSLIYTLTEHYIMPFIPKPGDPILKSYANLALPMIVNYLLIFYIIFECVCNAFAEMTYFADREFYQDWWNSTSWDEFARKWNKPVHIFLLRHVYASTIATYKLSKLSATFVTFLLSACCHELVMAVVSKKIRPYLFGMQMAQLPMTYFGRLPFMRRNKFLGNIIFWVGLMSGFPLLAIAYLVF